MDIEVTASEYINAMQVRFICGGYFKNQPEWGSSQGIINFSKLYYILDGECVIGIDGKEFVAEKGQLVLVPAGRHHSYRFSQKKKLEKYWCHFNANLGQSNLFDVISVPFATNVGRSKEIASLFEQLLFNTDKGNDLSDSVNQQGYLMLLLSKYFKTAGYTINSGKKSSPDFISVIKYMSENISESISVETLSDMIHIHPNYFIRIFKQHFGCSPIKFFNNMRIEKAKDQLRNTSLSIESVAKSVGCNDIYTFSKFFKANVGIAPTKYRNLNLNHTERIFKDENIRD